MTCLINLPVVTGFPAFFLVSSITAHGNSYISFFRANDDGRLKFVWKIGFSSAKSKSNKIFHRKFFKQKINFQRCGAFRLAFAGMVGKSLQPCLSMKYTVVMVGNEVEQSFSLEDFQML